jgi:hypothetical protein
MLAVAPLLLAGLLQADAVRLEVRAAGGEVTVHARGLPLSQVLDRLSTATGMDLTYEGARPSMPVTLSVDNVSEAEAVLHLMEGAGISYVMRTDSTGKRVDLLIVSGAGAGTVVASSSQPPAEAPYEEPVAEYGHIPLDPAVVEAAGGPQKPDLNNPYLGLPPSVFPQAVPGYQPPPAMDDGTGSASGSRSAPMPGTPTFPQHASFPRR